jgi:peptidoglycan/xylan/chitin deacetylase (PgdA/CDA1 family)
MSRGLRWARLGGALVSVGACAGAVALEATEAAAPTLQTGNVVLQRVGQSDRGAITRLVTGVQVVALSVDDGPDPRYTPGILAALARHRARATFFVVGASALAHPWLVRREVRAGDEVANHTLDHPRLGRLGAAATRREVDLGRRALVAAGAPEPLLFRAPYGEFTPNVAGAAARRGELMVGLSLTVERALDGRTIPAAIAWLMRRVRPGTIILAHDGLLDRSRTVAALPVLLDALARRGYGVITVSELLRRGGDLTTRRLLALGVRRVGP